MATVPPFIVSLTPFGARSNFCSHIFMYASLSQETFYQQSKYPHADLQFPFWSIKIVPILTKLEPYTVPCTSNLNRHACTNLGRCTRAQQVRQCTHGSILGTYRFALGRHLDTTEILRQAGVPRWASSTPNAGLIGHKIADIIWCSPNTIKCFPESVKSNEFWSFKKLF